MNRWIDFLSQHFIDLNWFIVIFRSFVICNIEWIIFGKPLALIDYQTDNGQQIPFNSMLRFVSIPGKKHKWNTGDRICKFMDYFFGVILKINEHWLVNRWYSVCIHKNSIYDEESTKLLIFYWKCHSNYINKSYANRTKFIWINFHNILIVHDDTLS